MEDSKIKIDSHYSEMRPLEICETERVGDYYASDEYTGIDNFRRRMFVMYKREIILVDEFNKSHHWFLAGRYISAIGGYMSYDVGLFDRGALGGNSDDEEVFKDLYGVSLERARELSK